MEMASLSLCFILFLHFSFLSFAHIDPSHVYQISYQPRAFIYKDFLSYEECDHLISLATDKLERSMVSNTETGEKMESKERTSSGMFIMKRQDEIVARIEHRIATWTLLPEENGERMQVLKYRTGEKYDPHWDANFYNGSLQWGGPRIATVIMYLSNVTKGGETIFPIAEGWHAQTKNEETWSECTRGVNAVKPAKGDTSPILAVKPVKGDALLFFSLNLDGTPDGASLHGGCPVIEGEKWSASQWIHMTHTRRKIHVSHLDSIDPFRSDQWI